MTYLEYGGIWRAMLFREHVLSDVLPHLHNKNDNTHKLFFTSSQNSTFSLNKFHIYFNFPKASCAPSRRRTARLWYRGRHNAWCSNSYCHQKAHGKHNRQIEELRKQYKQTNKQTNFYWIVRAHQASSFAYLGALASSCLNKFIFLHNIICFNVYWFY